MDCYTVESIIALVSDPAATPRVVWVDATTFEALLDQTLLQCRSGRFFFQESKIEIVLKRGNGEL